MSLCSLYTHELYTFKPALAVRHNKPTHSVGMLKQPIQIFVHKLAYEQKSASAAFYKSGFTTFRLMALLRLLSSWLNGYF